MGGGGGGSGCGQGWVVKVAIIKRRIIGGKYTKH